MAEDVSRISARRGGNTQTAPNKVQQSGAFPATKRIADSVASGLQHLFKPRGGLAIEKATRCDHLARGRRLSEQFHAHRLACAFCRVARSWSFRRVASGASTQF